MSERFTKAEIEDRRSAAFTHPDRPFAAAFLQTLDDLAALQTEHLVLIERYEHELQNVAATERELERWKHGKQIEGDYVCPHAMECDTLREALMFERESHEPSVVEENLAHERAAHKQSVDCWNDDCAERDRLREALRAVLSDPVVSLASGRAIDSACRLLGIERP